MSSELKSDNTIWIDFAAADKIHKICDQIIKDYKTTKVVVFRNTLLDEVFGLEYLYSSNNTVKFTILDIKRFTFARLKYGF